MEMFAHSFAQNEVLAETLIEASEYDMPPTLKDSLALPNSSENNNERVAGSSSSDEGRKVEQYWLEQFRAPVSLLNLPTDRPRPAVREFEGATNDSDPQQQETK